jgi:hypothetical protein
MHKSVQGRAGHADGFLLYRIVEAVRSIYIMCKPPSTITVVPVMNELSLDASQRMG